MTARREMREGVASYDRGFFEDLRGGSASSAEVVWPMVAEMLAPCPPRTIVDVGCGDGTWLAVATRALGVDEVIGLDGEYVLQSGVLRIPRDRFVAVDLAAEAAGLHLRVTRKFDLAVSLEVAEHLPRVAADPFVSSLVRLAPVVLFSAAIPNQGGQSHLNEEWPEAWVERFAAHGYRPVDALRLRLWNLRDVRFWYKQNTILFASDEALGARVELAELARETARRGVPNLVHPELFSRQAEALAECAERLRSPLHRAAGFATRAIRRITGRMRGEGKAARVG